MEVFLFVVLLAACEGHSITKHRNGTARSRRLMNRSVDEELKILKEELIRTNAKLQAMETTQQCLHGRLLETVHSIYKLLLIILIISLKGLK